jgi:hypothetical protein
MELTEPSNVSADEATKLFGDPVSGIIIYYDKEILPFDEDNWNIELENEKPFYAGTIDLTKI